MRSDNPTTVRPAPAIAAAAAPATARTWRQWAARGLVIGALGVATLAQAQFTMVPQPMASPDGVPRPSQAAVEQDYRIDAARHIYATYPMRVYRGKLPPLLYSVMMVETEIDATGQVVNISVVRKPAADEVAPWVQAMIRRAGPFPAPTKINGNVTMRETWFVDKSGLFQLMSLTEGQR